jgi:hypothetical protein
MPPAEHGRHTSSRRLGTQLCSIWQGYPNMFTWCPIDGFVPESRYTAYAYTGAFETFRRVGRRVVIPVNRLNTPLY